jgi:hypothetical protein
MNYLSSFTNLREDVNKEDVNKEDVNKEDVNQENTKKESFDGFICLLLLPETLELLDPELWS